jgi:pullulanase/glycogen debranching enzyme
VTNALEHRTDKTLGKGTHFPLGATVTPDGVNFAVYSQHATELLLLLFDEPDADPTDVIQLVNRDKFIWHALVKGIREGHLYGYKARGEYRPEWGLRFNDAKLLLDPYAKAVTGKCRNIDNLLLPYDPRPGAGESVLDTRDKISWFDWTAASRHGDLVDFFRKAIALTRRFPIFQSRRFYLGDDVDADGVPDLTWFGPDLNAPRWEDPGVRTICYQLDAREGGDDDDADRLFVVLNGHFDPQRVTLPPAGPGRAWHRAIDTSLASGEDFAEPRQEIMIDPSDHYLVNPRSCVLLLSLPPARR